jgi:sodium transport system permease protein
MSDSMNTTPATKSMGTLGSPSTMKTIGTVTRKELVDHLRDKRTILLVLLLSVALGPLMLFGLSYFIGSVESKAEKREVYVLGQANAPALMNFLLRQDMKVLEPKPNFRQLVAEGQHDAVLVIPKDFSEKLATGEAKLEIVYDDTRQGASAFSARPIRSAVRGFASEIANQRLIARGVSPAVLRPIEITDTNMGSASTRAASLLIIIPWVTLIGCVAGAMAMAIDLVAGERERGSLEPMLMNPIERRGLVLGKAFALSLYSLGIAALTLLGFALTIKYGKLPVIGNVLSLSPAQYAGFFAMLVSFAPAMTVVMMALATYGRNYKEGQTYASYAMQLISLLPIVPMLGQLKEDTWQLFVPVLAQLMVITRLLRGETVNAMHYAIPSLVNLAIFVAAVMLVSHLLRQERIVFGRA